jgi:hypothetical protein
MARQAAKPAKEKLLFILIYEICVICGKNLCSQFLLRDVAKVLYGHRDCTKEKNQR